MKKNIMRSNVPKAVAGVVQVGFLRILVKQYDETQIL